MHSSAPLWLYPQAATYREIKHLVGIQNGIEGFLNWWQISHGNTLIYQHLAKRLLIMPSVGSMAVKRVAKPLKHSAIAGPRSALGNGSASMLLRVGLNLRFLYTHRQRAAHSAALYLTGIDAGKVGLPHKQHASTQ